MTNTTPKKVSRFARYRERRRDELLELRKEVARLQAELERRDQWIKDMLQDRTPLRLPLL